MRSSRTYRALALVILLIAQAARGDEVTPEAVKETINRGTQYLLKQQAPNGTWTDYMGQPTGVTSLATLALLNSGETAKNPKVAKALDSLNASELPRATYAASLQIMAFCQADPARYKVKINELAMWLEATQIKEGKNKGGWHYGTRGDGDNSNTQFAMLALHEAERAGVKIKEQTWKLAEQYWLNNAYRQKEQGSWSYFGEGGGSGSMTCAAVASLIIARDHIGSGDAVVLDGRIQCCGNGTDDEAITKGVQWLGKKFMVVQNPGSGAWGLYYLYGLERVGRMTGQRFFGEGDNQHDWYREGAEHLLGERVHDKFSGYWKGTGPGENDAVVCTSLALLFLSKGRRPVVVSKLQYQDVTRDWDLHRRAIQNLTSRLEKPFKRELSWQSINFTRQDDVAGRGSKLNVTVADLLESPILFISGSQSLNLDGEQVAMLREYVNQGGFIFAEACEGDGCGGGTFDKDIRALMKKMFPESELRRLPPDHAVWYAEHPVNPKHLPADDQFWLWGLDACCRTSVVYCPRSLSCRWEVSHPYRELNYPQKVKDEIEACVRIGENVVAYATNRQLKEKLEKPQITQQKNDEITGRGTLVIPKLNHGGGADDATNALSNLLVVFEKQLEMKVDSKHRPPMAATDPKLLDYPILFMHGRRAFTWSTAERKAIKVYLDHGGFLFADSICASKEFTDSVRAEMKAIYPESQFVRIPTTHQMLSTEFHGFDVTTVTLRDPQLREDGDALTAKLVKTAPLLEGLDIGGRTAVILSPYDISCALEKGASLECKGYVPQDAARIGANVILFGLQQ
ncbi:MAG: DUF4159 domain-containing protein [Planctomycetales bacterium]|nr:DUF4159 domain-containing protein [Planctomycetales bacterium]